MEATTILTRGEVRLTSWRMFIDFVYRDMLDYEAYIWRGQRRSDWKLEPKLERIIGDGRMSAERRSKFVESHLEQFKFSTRGRRGPSPQPLNDENDWWALGQHHGLATPLLDWSVSPFVAAYFAYIDQGAKQTPYRAIYALHRPSVDRQASALARIENARRKEQLKEAADGKIRLGLMQRALLSGKIEPEITFIRPPSDENQRLVNQGALFTRTPSGVPLDDWVSKNHDKAESGISLMRVLVPNKDRAHALRMLNRMNINHLSLFPDLQGASTYCNLYAEIEKY
jgi:FRG domain